MLLGLMALVALLFTNAFPVECAQVSGHAGKAAMQMLEAQFKKYLLPDRAWPFVADIMGHGKQAQPREAPLQRDVLDEEFLELGSERELPEVEMENESVDNWDLPEEEDDQVLLLRKLGNSLTREEKKRLLAFLTETETIHLQSDPTTHKLLDIPSAMEHVGLIDFDNMDRAGDAHASNGTSSELAVFWADAKAQTPPVEIACGGLEQFYITFTGFPREPFTCRPFDRIMKVGTGCTFDDDVDVGRILKLVNHTMPSLVDVSIHNKIEAQHVAQSSTAETRRQSTSRSSSKGRRRRRRRRRKSRAARRRRRRRSESATKPPTSPPAPPAPPAPPTPPVETGCVPKTEWKPVKGSEDCASRGVKRRDEMPGFEPAARFPTATDLGSGECGKVCPQKYLLARWWLPRMDHLAGFPWQTYENWCAGRAARGFRGYAKGVSFYRRHQVCEVFSKCPSDELENAKDREHMQVEELCPLWYETERKLDAENGDSVSLPVKGFCYMKPNPANVAKTCLANGNTCLGKNKDVHLAVKSCVNRYGRYDGMNSKGLHVCYFDAKKPIKVKTFVFDWGKSKEGRNAVFKEAPKCNTMCGHLRTWHMLPMSRHSRMAQLPHAICGQCRAQQTICAQDKDGYSSWAGFTYGPSNKTDKVESSKWGKLVKGPDFEWGKRNHICCELLDCSVSYPGWKDDADGKKPCEENPGNIQIVHPFGSWMPTYGYWRPTKVQGNSAPNAQTDKNTCFQTHKHFRPHPDFFDWHRTGKSSRQYCYPRTHEVPVSGSAVCAGLASVGQCMSKPAICKWNAPELQGECRPKVVPGSEKCESPTTTCPTGKPCQSPSVDSGCDYPSVKEAMADLHISEQGFTMDGKQKLNLIKYEIGSDILSWSGMGARPAVNTTWFTLQEHGWKGKDGKCVTRVYPVSGGEGVGNGNFLGLACKARPIDHPKLSWNGEPCTKVSTSKECGKNSEICKWKPGPKCDIRHFHEISYRCVACKDYYKPNGNKGYNLFTGDGRLQTTYCRKCATWQQYFSKYKSEYACHILEHFFGLGPELTSRIDVHSPAMDDHGKSPDGTSEFLFDGKRTCVMATASTKQHGRGADQAFSPKNGGAENAKKFDGMKQNSQVNVTYKAGYVCEGGQWFRYCNECKKRPTWLPGVKKDIERGNPNPLWGPYYFAPCNPTEGTTNSFPGTGKNNFYETLEALAEAIKAGGRHPECPANVRPMPEEPQVEAKKSSPSPWNCNGFSKDDLDKRRNILSSSSLNVNGRKVKGCHEHVVARISKETCESFYQWKDGKKEACVWDRDSVPTPYMGRCWRCGADNLKKNLQCGPGASGAPKECHPTCVLPLWWPSRNTYTLLSPCTRFLNRWGFCGCSALYKSISAGLKHQMTTLKGIDCRGCSAESISKMLGDSPCEKVAPLLPPALCLALKALGVADKDIGKMSRKPHWQHGMEYHIGDAPSCVAAGEPQHSCVGVTSTCWHRCASVGNGGKMEGGVPPWAQCFIGPSTKCSNSLWCAGARIEVALNLKNENSNITGGMAYGSWGAQAQQLKLALQNGGEHPSCPRQVTRPNVDPCFEMADAGKLGTKDAGEGRTGSFRGPSEGSTRVCDSDCEKFPVKCWYDNQNKKKCGPPGGLKCGLRYRFPTMFGPDAILADSNQGEFWGSLGLSGWSVHMRRGANAFWQCQDAGYKLGPPPKWGPDEVDAKYLAQDYNLYKTDLFGRGICSENRREYCGSTTITNQWIPGCRRGMINGTTCSGPTLGQRTKDSACVCGDMSKEADKPNTIRSFDVGVDTCNRADAEQGPFECLGELQYLAPGESLRWGFRCKTDENMPGYAHFYKAMHAKPPCPKGNMNCESSLWKSQRMTHLGRFSPGSNKVKACVRAPLRCNGFCNCGDCSDEKNCEKLPKVLGVPWRRIGWDTKLRCPRSGAEKPPYPKGVISCHSLDPPRQHFR